VGLTCRTSGISFFPLTLILSPSLQANLYPQVRGGGLVRITHWLISIVKRPWNRSEVSKTSVNEDYEDTYYNILSFELQRKVVTQIQPDSARGIG